MEQHAHLTSHETLDPNECWALRRGRPHIRLRVSMAKPESFCRTLGRDERKRRDVCFDLCSDAGVYITFYFARTAIASISTRNSSRASLLTSTSVLAGATGPQ